ncbi:MAG: hypothetical protein R3B09_01110 [Nannocystaceae bacterium]
MPRSNLALAFTLILSACSGSEEAAAPVSPELQEQRELASLADDLRNVIDEHPGKCKAMGEALNTWYTAHGARFDELRKRHTKLPGDEWGRWNRMLQAINRGQTCVGNPILGMDDPQVKRVLGALAL